jgi:tetratricopeptide (TPR) repeat protein
MDMETGRTSPFEMWMRKGDVYFQLHRWKSAIHNYREAARAHPLNGPIHLKLGLALLMDHFFYGKEVESTLKTALERRDNLSEARFMLAMFYLDIGLFSKARQELKPFNPDEISRNLSHRMMRDLSREDLERNALEGYLYTRTSWREKLILALLYFTFFFFLFSYFLSGIQGHLLSSLALLPLILVTHIMMAKTIQITGEGIFYHSPFSRLSIPWEDITGVRRDADGVLKIVMKGRSVSLNNAWENFEDLSKRIKLELYHRNWTSAV